MKRIYLVAIFFWSFISIGTAQFHIGAGTQFMFEGTVLGLQAKAFYESDETWRGAGTFTIHLDKGVNWSVDLDGHYMLIDIADSYNIAPMAGINLINVGQDASSTDIGLNIGAFVDLNFDGKKVYVEPKYIIGRSTLVISGGLYF